jgi:hypothetical protein
VHVQDAAHGRLDVAGDVGVPHLARHVLGGLVGVDDENLGVAVEQRGRSRVQMQLTEEPSERLLLVRRQALVAEEDDAVVDQGVVDLLERALVERLGEVDAPDLGAGVRGELVDLDRDVGHAPVLLPRSATARGRGRLVARPARSQAASAA